MSGPVCLCVQASPVLAGRQCGHAQAPHQVDRLRLAAELGVQAPAGDDGRRVLAEPGGGAHDALLSWSGLGHGLSGASVGGCHGRQRAAR